MGEGGWVWGTGAVGSYAVRPCVCLGRFVERGSVSFAVTMRLTGLRWQGKEGGSRFRANAHISKSRYGAPDFVASTDVGHPGVVSQGVYVVPALVQKAFGYAFVGVYAAVA